MHRKNLLFSLDHLVGDRDLVFEEEAQHFPRGVRSSRIGEGAGRAAPRPRVCGSVDFPVLKDCAAARVGMNRSGIGMSSGDPTAMHRLSRVCGSHRPRDDMIAVARMHRGVAIAVSGPSGVGNQVSISSHRKLLSSKAMVVSVAETSGHDPGRQG